MTLVACGSDDAGSGRGTTAKPTKTSDRAPTRSIDGRFSVDGNKRQLAVRCWGNGSPTVIWDAGLGVPGISGFENSSIVLALAARVRVCSYDRAGLGMSDAAALRKRVLDDTVTDLHALVAAAHIPGPLILVGSSGGGLVAYHYAGRHPEEVAAIVMLDVPPGRANVPADEVPAWDSPRNTEHIDLVAIMRQMALHRLPVRPIPVTVVTASHGLSANPAEQKVWLQGSSSPVQVVLDGGHAIHDDDPAGVLAAITNVLERAGLA